MKPTLKITRIKVDEQWEQPDGWQLTEIRASVEGKDMQTVFYAVMQLAPPTPPKSAIETLPKPQIQT